ncbi:MAG: DnaJ domain-containing protein [Erythrobacter sp.]|nr:DnaJ domain-containing protein [Erythrobacter sp.]
MSSRPNPSSRFHGRVERAQEQCEAPGCREAGEFRAPGRRPNGFDGPGEWRWFCLDHVREFNAGYDWFDGMSAEEIIAAQSPIAGWRTESRTFRPDAGVDGVPRWADYADPLDAIAARARGIRSRAEREGQMAASGRFSREEAQALESMGLGSDTDRTRLRRRYSELVRRYHPDRNGGDRRHEARLNAVVDAYQLLRKSAALA